MIPRDAFLLQPFDPLSNDDGADTKAFPFRDAVMNFEGAIDNCPKYTLPDGTEYVVPPYYY